MASVYPMRMARVNIYLPDELADKVRDSGLNVSAIAREALQVALAARHTDAWLAATSRLPSTGVTHAQALAALKEARAELWEADA